MKLQPKKWSVLLCLLPAAMLRGTTAEAQVLTPDLPENRPLILVEEQYRQAHYAMAAQSATAYLNAHPQKVHTKNAGDIDKVKYYRALSFLKADMPGSVDTA